MAYRIFVRNWWKKNPETGELEPDPTARKHHLGTARTEDEARRIAKEYNRTHDPGPLSRKAEFEEITR